MPKIKIIKLTNNKFIAKRRVLGLCWKIMREKNSNKYQFNSPEELQAKVEEYISFIEEQKSKKKNKRAREVYVWKTFEF